MILLIVEHKQHFSDLSVSIPETGGMDSMLTCSLSHRVILLLNKFLLRHEMSWDGPLLGHRREALHLAELSMLSRPAAWSRESESTDSRHLSLYSFPLMLVSVSLIVTIVLNRDDHQSRTGTCHANDDWLIDGEFEVFQSQVNSGLRTVQNGTIATWRHNCYSWTPCHFNSFQLIK